MHGPATTPATGGTTVDGLLEALGHYLHVEAGRVLELGGLGSRSREGFLEAGQPAEFGTYLAANPVA